MHSEKNPVPVQKIIRFERCPGPSLPSSKTRVARPTTCATRVYAVAEHGRVAISKKKNYRRKTTGDEHIRAPAHNTRGHHMSARVSCIPCASVIRARGRIKCDTSKDQFRSVETGQCNRSLCAYPLAAGQGWSANSEM